METSLLKYSFDDLNINIRTHDLLSNYIYEDIEDIDDLEIYKDNLKKLNEPPTKILVDIS